MAAVAIAAAAVPAQAAPGDPPDTLAWVGRPVASIRVRAPDSASLGDLSAALAQRRGEPYSIEAMRASMQNLVALAGVSSARVLATEGADGLHVVVEITPQPHLHELRFEGETRVGRGELQRAMTLRIGDPLRPDDPEAEAARIQERLSEHGFLLSEVEARVETRDDPVAATLVIAVRAGERARLRRLAWTGEHVLPDVILAATLGMQTGARYRPLDLDEGLLKLREMLVARRFFYGQVWVARQALNPRANTVDLTIAVETGPRVTLDVSGFRGSDDELRRLLPVFENRSVDDWVLKESRHELVSWYQQRGYWKPLVIFRREQDELQRNVRVQIRILEGRRTQVKRLDFVGGEGVSAESLKAAIRTHASSFLAPGRFVSAWWEQDLDAILALYRRAGFAEAEIIEAIVDYDAAIEGLRATIVVDEGPVTRTAGVRFEVSPDLTAAEIESAAWMERLRVRPGGPFWTRGVRQDSDVLRSLLANAGYPRAIVSATWRELAASPGADRDPGSQARRAAAPARDDRSSAPSPDDVRWMEVVHRIDQGERVRIDRVLIAGNERTADNVIRRELLFVPGSAYSLADLIDSQSRLYRLGIFNRVSVAPAVDEPLAARRTMIVHVRETPPKRVTYGFGLDTEEGPRGLLTIGHDNIAGMDRHASFSVRASFREQRIQALFEEPYLFGRRLVGSVSGYFESVRQESFDVERLGGAVQILIHHSPTFTTIPRYSFRRVRTHDVQIDPRLLDREDRNVLIGSVGTSLIRDTRLDPIFPSSGSYHTLDVEVAALPFGSESSFARLFGRAYRYWRVWPTVVVATAVRAGLALPFAGADSVPLPERFFAGGSTTLRGFAPDEAGPTDEFGQPLGGEVLLIGNLEARVAVRGDLGVVAFLDIGNVFSDLDEVSVGGLREVVGLGVRYDTAIGPVRLDVGRLMDRAPRESRYQLYVSVGHTF